MRPDPQTIVSKADKALSLKISALRAADAAALSRCTDSASALLCCGLHHGGNLRPPIHSTVFILFLRWVQLSSGHLPAGWHSITVAHARPHAYFILMEYSSLLSLLCSGPEVRPSVLIYAHYVGTYLEVLFCFRICF